MCSGNVVDTSKVRNAITLCCHVKNHKKYKAHVKNNFYVKYLPFVQIDTDENMINLKLDIIRD